MIKELSYYGYKEKSFEVDIYKIGDKITVTFTGTIRQMDGHDLCAKIVDDSDCGLIHYIYLSSSAVKIKRADPESWPPQVGDIWEAKGHEYYVRASTRLPGEPFAKAFDTDQNFLLYLSSESDKFKALNPRLVRRREA